MKKILLSGLFFSFLFSVFAEDNMVFVQGGEFLMGSVEGEEDESPLHSVVLNDFYMSKYEITQSQYTYIMGSNPSSKHRGIGAEFPVNNVNWYDTIRYCNTLSRIEGLSPTYIINGDIVECNFNANGYRLPTEAEWEYAAVGGQKSNGYIYSGSDSFENVGWIKNNSASMTHKIGQKQANELGLYDMTGNVWEWCWDWFGPYSAHNQRNPKGVSDGTNRVFRGGSWSQLTVYNRTANRYDNVPEYKNYDLGFRIVRSQK